MYEHELRLVRQLHTQTTSELDETVKVAELLYDVNWRLGSVTDYLLRQQGMLWSDNSPKSVEVLINSLLELAEEAPSKLSRDHEPAARGVDDQPSGQNDAPVLH